MSADILILDEPTNHLDNSMADWLEDYLKKWKGALIMVTHDRYFLDSVANRIIEIDKGNIYSYQDVYKRQVLNFCFLHPLCFMSPEYYFQKLL